MIELIPEHTIKILCQKDNSVDKLILFAIQRFPDGNKTAIYLLKACKL